MVSIAQSRAGATINVSSHCRSRLAANFEQAAAEIAALLPTALFVSFDEELSGIAGNRNNDISLFDSPNERYKKTSAIASKYNIVQLGLCLFHAVRRLRSGHRR